MADADGRDGGVRRLAGRVVEGSQLQDACPGIHADSEALEDIGAQDAVGAGGEAARGDFDQALFENEIAEGHGACQGDMRFIRAGFAETAQAGGGDGFQRQVPGRAGMDRDAARAGIQQQAEGLAAVDPRRDQDAGLRGSGGTESGERQPVGGIRAGEPRREASLQPLVNLAQGDGAFGAFRLIGPARRATLSRRMDLEAGSVTKST